MDAARIEIPNARQPFEGIVTGGQPTPAQLGAAQGAGFKTIVNLRPDTEMTDWDEADRARALGLNYVSIPVAGAAGLTEDNARALAEVVDNPEARPMIVHCGSGNRVGALFALKAAWVDGEDTERALEIGRQAGLTGLEDRVRSQLEHGPA
ncbi:MAG TPA: protein tyrosine phosphatase family protein [Gammaproteobacteria bacterium]|nr:protein tyrosine phosphatase family protein [Gammaproteobacteria bacterium]